MKREYTKINFFRHAQSISNLEARLSGGADDVPLTELGKNQASKSGAAFLGAKDNLSYIVHSDMIRTSETAAIINSHLNLEMRKDANLREKYFGNLEGMKVSEFKKLLSHSSKDLYKFVVEHGGEDEAVFVERVKTTFCNYFNSGELEIAIVSHGIYGKTAYQIFYGREYNFKNAEHVVFDPASIDVMGICGFDEYLL